MADGTYGNCSPEQLKALEELKKKVMANENVKKRASRYDEVTLLRFIRARGWDVSKAEQMVVDDANWRENEKVDTAKEDFLAMGEHAQGIVDFWPRREHGKSHEGDLAYFERTTIFDPRTLLNAVPHPVLSKFSIYNMETLHERLSQYDKENGKPRDRGIVFVMDLNGLGWKHFYTPALNILKERSRIIKDHYPEYLHRLIIINAPSIFNMFFSLFKGLLDPRTLDKIMICGSDYLPELEKIVPKHHIPRYLGGACSCEDGKCIPNNPVYKSNKVSTDESGVQKEEVVVKAWGNFEKEIEISKKGTIVGYDFRTQDYDIGFAVFLKTEDARKDIVAYARFNSHEQEVSGSFEVTEPGTYVLQWDNTYSNMRSKTLSYAVSIQPPEEN